jgi:hypothetical protein
MTQIESENDTSVPQTDATNLAGVALSASAGVQEQSLTVEYRVQNGRRETIYLVNRVFQWTRSGLSLDAGLVYTEVKQGQLWLNKACLAVPEHIKVESPDVPYLSKVIAGETFVEKVSIPLPLRPYHPYDQVKESGEVNTFDGLHFAVGWFPEGKVTVRSVTHPDGLSLLSADYGPLMREQAILVVSLPVSVPTWIEP